MSQISVGARQDQWQKGQVATSHTVRDITRRSSDVSEITFGELVVFGIDPEYEVRQPDATIPAVTGKSYAIETLVVTVTSAAHGLEVGQEVVISADSNVSDKVDGTQVVTGVPTVDTFTFATTFADRSGETLTYAVPAFTQKDIAGIVVKPVSGGSAKRFSDGVITISLDDLVTVLQEGDIAVLLGDPVTAGDDAFYVNTPGGSSDQYTWRNSVDTDKAVQTPGRFMQSGSAGDIVMLRFNTDAVLGS